MARDTYKAIWVSHSSMGDFLKCPRAYYLHNVYKDPKTGRKINIVNPALSLGQAVHVTIESLKNIPVEKRLGRDLLHDFEQAWQKVSGKMGGFSNASEEAETKKRGLMMIGRVAKNLGPIAQKTVRLKENSNGMPPHFFLSDDDNIILCGLIDWLEYIESDDSVRILDFKTGKHDEGEDSLQLPIYLLLLNALQKRTISGASYWYLDRDDQPIDMPLPNIDQAKKKILEIALQIKKTRESNDYKCPRGSEGCFACKPYEAIIQGQTEYIGIGGYGQDMYFLPI